MSYSLFEMSFSSDFLGGRLTLKSLSESLSVSERAEDSETTLFIISY